LPPWARRRCADLGLIHKAAKAAKKTGETLTGEV
jgi:hypothetical protein